MAATELFAERGFDGRLRAGDRGRGGHAQDDGALPLRHEGSAARGGARARRWAGSRRCSASSSAGPFERERVGVPASTRSTPSTPSTRRWRGCCERELLDPVGSEAYLRLFVDPIYVPAMRELRARDRRRASIRRDRSGDVHPRPARARSSATSATAPLLERLRPGVDPYSVEALIARREYLVDRIFRAADAGWPRDRRGSARPDDAEDERRQAR